MELAECNTTTRFFLPRRAMCCWVFFSFLVEKPQPPGEQVMWRAEAAKGTSQHFARSRVFLAKPGRRGGGGTYATPSGGLRLDAWQRLLFLDTPYVSDHDGTEVTCTQNPFRIDLCCLRMRNRKGTLPFCVVRLLFFPLRKSNSNWPIQMDGAFVHFLFVWVGRPPCVRSVLHLGRPLALLTIQCRLQKISP